MDKKSKTKTPKKTSKALIIGTIVLTAVALGAGMTYGSYLYSTVKHWDECIYPGVKVMDVDLSGKTKQEALKLINDKYGKALLQKNIVITTPNKSYTIGYDKLAAKYNVDETVNEAFKYGKNLSKLSKYKLIKSATPKEYKLKFTYDSKPLKDMIGPIEQEVNKSPKDASLRLNNDGSFSVTGDEKGLKLNKEQLEKDILSKVDDVLGKNIEVKAPIEEIKPSKTSEALKSVDNLIASFSTSFGPTKDTARITNITLGTRAINGILLMPGETFSFNGTVGDTTPDKGYMAAGVIVNNKLEQGYGGGICQVSTTLYNALIRANIRPTERLPHSLPVSYVPLGLDATIAYGGIDFKFKNPFNYPIYIQTYVEGFTTNVRVYSNHSLKNRNYEPYSEVTETIEPKINYVDDPNLPEGEQVVETKPHTGYKVKSYLKVFENNNLVETQSLYNDFYKPVDGVIKKGTKKVSEAAPQTPAPAQPSTNQANSTTSNGTPRN